MDDMIIERGAMGLMDRGYVDYNRLYSLFHVNGAFFVTRLKINTKYEVIA